MEELRIKAARKIREMEDWIPRCYSDEWIIEKYKDTLLFSCIVFRNAVRATGREVAEAFGVKL